MVLVIFEALFVGAYALVADSYEEYQTKYVQAPMEGFLEECFDDKQGLLEVSKKYESISEEAEAYLRFMNFKLYSVVIANILAAYMLSLGAVKILRYKI